MFVQPATAALWFFVCTLPICAWVIYTDLKWMKIRNTAVLALLAVYVVVGFLTLPLDDYLWRYLHLAVVLAVVIVMNMIGGFGGGDAKFLAAMAPFVAYLDAGRFMYLLAMCILAAFVVHRVVRRLGFVRRLAPDWVSWDAKKFPLGTALGLSLPLYLGLAAFG